jgi:hypothetical protein
MNWSDIDGLDVDQAAEAIWQHNHTRTRLETIRSMLGAAPTDLKGYRPDGDYKHQMVNLGPYAEKVVARVLTDGDNIALRSPDNNNARDIYFVNNGRVQDRGLQVKLGDPNEHIFYSLRKRLARGHADDIVLDDSLVSDGRLGEAFTPYKRRSLQTAIDGAGVRVLGVPGLLARARTERAIDASRGVRSGILRMVRAGQNLKYSKKIDV